jgi:protein tyrosine/serine phosphatase/predicted nucleotidyltransferase
MKQNIIIRQIADVLIVNSHVDTAFLYGSFARGSHNVNSDIDVAIVMDKYCDIDNLLRELQKSFCNQLLYASKVNLRNKIVLYFNGIPKAEISYSHDIKEHERFFLGSEVPLDMVADCILFDKTGRTLQHLQSITQSKHCNADNDHQKEIANLIDKFIYEFESCSNAHRRSDGYHFYFFYNIALQIAVQLKSISHGQTKYNFLPKSFIANTLRREEQENFYSLRGSLFLPEANAQKRKLLDFFYSSIRGLMPNKKMEELIQFCEAIYSRDFLWNFRDISQHNPKIRSGVIYRTATMTLFQKEDFFGEFIQAKKIKTVVDLRAEKEVKESNYTENSLRHFNWVHAPFDPWNQSIEFQAEQHQGTDIEIAYRFFIIECKNSIQRAIEAILNEQNSTAIHCYAGKDRTGIFISLLHLLSGAEIETVYNDYLATETDTKKEYLNIILDIIDNHNGIEEYLLSCGLLYDQIFKLKKKLINK